ncbi:5-formyltetrahydrofolate cyclo-ligase [Geminocystis sp. NIES-3709]|uniref:5-formyltetrahydrofolate cyclo-ligase n=1 Tax=Geminocystis sp. NIES-3709 TaxID=1617448 RepID=UPI0005FC8857|nr:5-formyltetrahydrofolate cyclo-ligase [Geminocystis sp. NIES-3709]BAQ66403.1 5-formyltetrahydrofolate cyclo-ligase [Geminocystis sp. NIES-3709]
MFEEKKRLRKKYLQKRLQLPLQEYRSKSNQICQNILNTSIFREAKVVLSYFSFKQEPDLTLLHQRNKVIWGLPRCEGKSLIWHQWQWGDNLQTGAYNIPEPLFNSPLIDTDTVDLILIPAVTIDRRGYRLGYGGGYYDRMLDSLLWQKIPTIGIVFDFAYVDHLPVELWDKPLKAVCTEFGIFFQG